ncbi:unnamed protein product [Medioppia subpectinata]|uniref:ABC transporter domain-containing protein n=1 Tax=Medioppia subpectinata TaxID=1979941 RepID=A0A7R9KGL9_9ACAR|nr:unnamed protein product [Medioppia subpectinata]CAG2103033.1 unnamed protein product [Medioppia subpectinata]
MKINERRAENKDIQSLSLSWLNIQVFTKCKKKNVSGEVKSGQLLAIMGASGAGKTTLLNVLTARNLSKLRVKGVVLLNKQAVSAETMASLSSYIEQHDLFHPLLTVREHLVFHSMLRMDKSFSRDQRSTFVDQLLIKFNLSKCRDTQIGGDFEFKGISGGEMKRLSDEPTTGLDSFMAQNIVQTLKTMASEGRTITLKTMASEGRTIVCTIHQPSSQVFALFDHILLMADGRVAFMGTTAITSNKYEESRIKVNVRKYATNI